VTPIRPTLIALIVAVVGFVYRVSCGLSSSGLPKGGSSGSGGDNRLPSSSRDDAEEVDWIFLGEIGGVRTYQRQMPNSSLLAFKGVMTMEDLKIGEMIGPFFSLDVTVRWVDMLEFIREYPTLEDAALESKASAQAEIGYQGEETEERDGGFFSWGRGRSSVDSQSNRKRVPAFGSNVMHQVCSLPWPLAKREFVMSRRVVFDEQAKTMHAYYASVEDPRFPHMNGVVRADTPKTLWVFQSHLVDGKQVTTMSLESEVDTKLPIPAAILNYMQRYWPSKSLNAFKKICKEEGHNYNIDPKLLPRSIKGW
jgi:hypothetical protein